MQIIITAKHRDENIIIQEDYMIDDDYIECSPPMLYAIVTDLKNKVMKTKAEKENNNTIKK